MPNGEHNGNLWLKPPFPCPEPETGRYSLTCSMCQITYAGFNWRTTSPVMFCNDGKEYVCDSCQVIVYQSMPYAEYLKTERWQYFRAEAMSRARNKCQMCSKTATQVHHNNYSRVGRENPEDLIALCGQCHAKHHGKVA